MMNDTHEMLPFGPDDLVVVNDKSDDHHNWVARVQTINLMTGDVSVKFVIDDAPAIYHIDQLVKRA